MSGTDEIKTTKVECEGPHITIMRMSMLHINVTYDNFGTGISLSHGCAKALARAILKEYGEDE